mmetsp:Transcript_12580/g.42541  ORF Transcript_12580/g.42541 Transcript_12580/m.42541 type:complete len:220 (-) Transcript_12580:79-738(-)
MSHRIGGEPPRGTRGQSHALRVVHHVDNPTESHVPLLLSRIARGVLGVKLSLSWPTRVHGPGQLWGILRRGRTLLHLDDVVQNAAREHVHWLVLVLDVHIAQAPEAVLEPPKGILHNHPRAVEAVVERLLLGVVRVFAVGHEQYRGKRVGVVADDVRVGPPAHGPENLAEPTELDDVRVVHRAGVAAEHVAEQPPMIHSCLDAASELSCARGYAAQGGG